MPSETLSPGLGHPPSRPDVIVVVGASREDPDPGTGNVDGSKRFCLSVASLSLGYHLLVAALCTSLATELPGVALGIAGYAGLGAAVSLGGLVGVVKRRSRFILPFARFLLVDTLLSAAARFLVVFSLGKVLSVYELCGEGDDSMRHLTDFRRRDLPSSAQDAKCAMAVGAVRMALFGVVVGLTALQGTIALAVRSFGKDVEQSERGLLQRRTDFVHMDEKVPLQAGELE